MRKKIYINCLLKDNMIISYHIGPNERTEPSDYYKDFIYANCKEPYENFEVKYMSVEFDENDDPEYKLNDYIFDEIARKFYMNWNIHSKHWGSSAY